jgi:hypothetical protein
VQIYVIVVFGVNGGAVFAGDMGIPEIPSTFFPFTTMT